MSTSPLIPLRLHHDEQGELLLAVGPGAGLLFVEQYFKKAKTVIRLASAYFSLGGYELAREHIGRGVALRILVGHSDGPKVQAAVLEEILADLGQCEINLAAAVRELVERIEQRKFFIRDARSLKTFYHCKCYSSDEGILWHGSTNFSRRGLLLSAEQASRAPDPLPEAALFNAWFDEVAEQGHDLLADLLARLQAWLKMATPFEVYLKVLSVLRTLPEPHRRPQARLPTHYQQMLVARVLRQLTTYDGALLIAATGLGKTVMGAEIAAHWQRLGNCRRILLLAPPGVKDAWREDLGHRDLLVDFFNLDLLFNPESQEPQHQVTKLDKCLQEADQHTLLLIDEAHYYRTQWVRQETSEPGNPYRKASRVYERLLPVARQGVRVVLLTATVYGTDTANLKSLLRLLPPKAGPARNQAWTVSKAALLAQLPVVTVLGIPHVLKLARDRGDVDENNRVFVQFGEERRYLPEVLHLRRHLYELPHQQRTQLAFDNGCFDQDRKIPQHYFSDIRERILLGMADSAYISTLSAWISSAAAVPHSLRRNLATPGAKDPPEQLSRLAYGNFMRLRKAARQSVLADLLVAFEAHAPEQDAKFHYLRTVVQTHCLRQPAGSQTGKVLVFVRQLPTALYLQAALTAEFAAAALRIVSTVGANQMGEPELKSRSKRDRILREFAPLANQPTINRTVKGPDYHVLIATDADGVGVNLQDADTLVHYDLPAAADVLYQRIGRLLRMTANPARNLTIYTLEPALAHVPELLTLVSPVQSRIQTRVQRLHQRHEDSRAIINTGVRTNQDQAQMPLEQEDIPLEQFIARGGFETVPDDGPAQAEITHAATLENHRSRAEQLPDFLLSACSYARRQPRIIVLVAAAESYHLLQYNLKTNKLENAGEAEILQALVCTPETELALVPTATVESSANLAVQHWCQSRRIEPAQALKICALYLDPQRNRRSGFGRVLTTE